MVTMGRHSQEISALLTSTFPSTVLALLPCLVRLVLIKAFSPEVQIPCDQDETSQTRLRNCSYIPVSDLLYYNFVCDL